MDKIIGTAKLLTIDRRKNGKIEFVIPVLPFTQNPYRQNEAALDAVIAMPSGKNVRVPCFFFSDGTGNAEWRLRFSSGETGKHRSRFILKLDGKVSGEADGPAFDVLDSDLPGIIRVAKNSPRYLEYSNGSPYFPVGQNLCFTSERTKRIPINPECGLFPVSNVKTLPWDVSYERWIGRMAENGANWFRIWMRPTFYLESGEPWKFDQENAGHLDHINELAEENSMKICLCFDDIRDFFHKQKGVSYSNWFSGYDTAWGRLLRDGGYTETREFFTAPEALEMMRDKLRYIVARWGYSSSIFAWEIWNEIQCVSDKEVVASWVKLMTVYLREIDPYGHLIKSPYYAPYDVVTSDMLTKEYGDINDSHPYYGWHGDIKPRDFAEFVFDFVRPLKEEPLAFMVSEAGIAREVRTTTGVAAEAADKDKTCVSVHESLWSGLFSGSCGTGMVWWWDENVDHNDCYWRFRGIAEFVKNVPFNNEKFALGEPRLSDQRLRARSLLGATIGLLWVRQKDFNWWNTIQGIDCPLVSCANAYLEVIKDSRYRVEFWDTVKGKILSVEERTAGFGILEIPLPEIKTDLALKVKRI